MKTVILSILIAAHLLVAAERINDLFTKSKRDHKLQWMIFILLVPVVGFLRYNSTMQRRRYVR